MIKISNLPEFPSDISIDWDDKLYFLGSDGIDGVYWVDDRKNNNNIATYDGDKLVFEKSTEIQWLDSTDDVIQDSESDDLIFGEGRSQFKISYYTRYSTLFSKIKSDIKGGYRYKVTLNPNGGTINSGNITYYVQNTRTYLPTDVTLYEMEFDGWRNNSELTGNVITYISENETGAKEYWAKWKNIEYSTRIATEPGAYQTEFAAKYQISPPETSAYSRTVTCIPNENFSFDYLSLIDDKHKGSDFKTKRVDVYGDAQLTCTLHMTLNSITIGIKKDGSTTEDEFTMTLENGSGIDKVGNLQYYAYVESLTKRNFLYTPGSNSYSSTLTADSQLTIIKYPSTNISKTTVFIKPEEGYSTSVILGKGKYIVRVISVE